MTAQLGLILVNESDGDDATSTSTRILSPIRSLCIVTKGHILLNFWNHHFPSLRWLSITSMAAGTSIGVKHFLSYCKDTIETLTLAFTTCQALKPLVDDDDSAVVFPRLTQLRFKAQGPYYRPQPENSHLRGLLAQLAVPVLCRYLEKLPGLRELAIEVTWESDGGDDLTSQNLVSTSEEDAEHLRIWEPLDRVLADKQLLPNLRRVTVKPYPLQSLADGYTRSVHLEAERAFPLARARFSTDLDILPTGRHITGFS
ncbi:hypothetical protein CC2G_014229 [Coprinopsis cinerea AmutBmut pab1-1]|nr:hypothetical protein CC2G_014229 [Coprinopsis cinerea AmutBmut pab1-1]